MRTDRKFYRAAPYQDAATGQEVDSLSKYVTRQRKVLLSYLRLHPDELLSAQEIASALEGESISLSAVYRNLADLEAEGKVRRAHRGSVREIDFRYLDTAACRNRLHLICTRCGKTAHMDSAEAESLVDTVAKRDGFAIDRAETVLYGLCGSCQAGDCRDGKHEEELHGPDYL